MKKYGILGVLVIALFARLYHISFPVAGFHAWRQADTAMIAKNFYSNGFNILYPQIDWGGNSPGYVETEFPIYSFLVSLLYALFSPADAIGRLLSVLFALITIYGLYALVKKYLGITVALLASLIYAIIPLNVYFTRAFMPESMMLMSSVLGIYFFSEWIERESLGDFILSVVFVSLAALIKLPTLYIGLPLLYLAWTRFGKRVFREWRLWIFAGIVFTAVTLWYYHAHQILLSSGLTFGIWDYGTGKWGNFAPLFTLKFYNDIFMKSIAERHLTYGGFILFILGLFVVRKSERERVFDWWLIALGVYFFIVATGNQVHEYYQLPFTLPASVFAAKAIDAYLIPPLVRERWKTRKSLVVLVTLCCVALPVLSFLRVQNFIRQEKLDGPVFKLADAVQRYTSAENLVVAVDEYDPVVLYRCARKGWHSTPEDLTDTFLKDKALMGARYLVGMKHYFDRDTRAALLNKVMSVYPAVIDADEYFILKLGNGRL